MKKNIRSFSQSFFWVFIICILNGAPLAAQNLRFNEVSGDSGNNDGTNDGIVELINTGATDFDAGCYVISNSEWIVVLPPGTIIAPGDVFLIACSEGQNVGSNPNTIPGSGLTCATCDFPNMPIDFDVCDPANADFVDWAATGFTIDNQADDDGDQIALFEPNGTVIAGVKWGGGATSVFDNTAVLSGSYTLGTPGTGGGGLSSAELPNSLLPGGACYQMGINYNMPIIMDAIYEDLTAAPNPGGKAINNSVLQGCNSSFIYSNGSWQKTDHPNPGQPNDSRAFQFNFSASAVQCASSVTDITVELEVYNWQAVTPGVTNAKGGIGSFVSFDSGATQIPWTTYNRNDVTGVTTMTYTFSPINNQTISLLWDDDKSSLFASTPTGSTSATAVVNNTTPSDCYTVEQHQIIVAPEMMASTTSVSCPTDFPAGTVNMGSLISGGYNVTYELFDNGVLQNSNNTGIFGIPDNFTGPITVVVTDGSGCTSPITIDIDNSCRQAPVCPADLNYDACTTLSVSVCPEDEVNLSIDAAMASGLPEGGVIEWVRVANPNDDPYLNGTVVATQTISVTSAIASVYISSYTPNPTGTDCTSGSEETIVLTNPDATAVDISGFVIIGNSGGMPFPRYTVPPGTMIAPGGTYSFNSCPDPGNSSQTFLANSNLPRTIQLEVNSAVVQTINYDAAAAGTAYAVADPNLSYNTSASATTLSPMCTTYTIPSDACNNDIHIRPRIVPVDVACSNPTLAALTYNVVCPTATLSGGGTACAESSVPLTIDFQNYTGNPTYIVEYTLNGMPQTEIMTTDDPYILNASASGEYILTSVSTDGGGNCNFSASGSATVEINAVPDISLAGTSNVCAGLIAEIPFTINAGTLPFNITYNIDNGANQFVEVFSNELNISTVGLSFGNHNLNIVSITDANDCNGTASGAAIINVLTTPDLAMPAPQTNICPSNSLNLNDLNIIDNNNTTGAFSYFATLSDVLNNVNSINSVIDATGIYYIRKETAQGCFDVISVSVTIETCCPDLSASAPAVQVTESTCGSGCMVGGGSLSAPGTNCPAGSTLQYSTDNGNAWTTTLPIYNQTEAITILTRCNCDADNTQSSPTSSVTTMPGTCTPPTAFNVTGGGAFCMGGAGIAVGLGDSEIGVIYQLQLNGANLGVPVAGTGDAISFGNQLLAGDYTVVATNSLTDCTQNSLGNATITIDPLPVIELSTTVPICQTKTLLINTLAPEIIYTGDLSALQYTWSFVEAGDNGTFVETSSTDPTLGTYIPGIEAIARGFVTLRLTVDNPNDACTAVSDTVRVSILRVNCGAFPWNGEKN